MIELVGPKEEGDREVKGAPFRCGSDVELDLDVSGDVDCDGSGNVVGRLKKLRKIHYE